MVGAASKHVCTHLSQRQDSCVVAKVRCAAEVLRYAPGEVSYSLNSSKGLYR